MMPTLHDLGIDQLSAADRLDLISEIWDSLADHAPSEIPESHRRELDRRLALLDQQTTPGSTWEEARDRLWGRK